MKDGQTIGQWLKWDFEVDGKLKIEGKNGRRIYTEDSKHWLKFMYDPKGEPIYYENSDGEIIDNRTPEIIEHNGRKYKLIP